MTGRRPSIEDVGRRASVSRQTVSRVLNGSPLVSEGARRRVEAAIAELHYRPSWAARALVTGRADVLGVVTTRLTSYGPAETLAGFERAAARAGLAVQVANVPAGDPAEARAAAGRLLDCGVAGLAVQVPLDELDVGVPVIGLGVPAGPYPAVRVDQAAGAREATEHLLAAGHETVWHVAGPADCWDGSERAAGWRLALQEAGAQPPPVVPAADWSAAAGYVAGRVLRELPGVTAVFAAGDCLALGVLAALHEHGLDVPGRVAVIGFDDVPEAEHFTPPLTTVRPDFAAVGREALQLLLPQLRTGASGGKPRTIRPRLVLRASAATAASVRGTPGRQGIRADDRAPRRSATTPAPRKGRLNDVVRRQT
ncbi:LacI family DNA-binding transcriptional regulator [Geodermatophilus sp. URMC 64]